MVQFDSPWHLKSSFSSSFKVGWIPLSHYWLCGVIRIPPNSEMDEVEDFQCILLSNLTICSPLSLFHSDNFPSFSLSYWGGQFLLPHRANNGKGEFTQLLNWKRHRGFSVRGFQAGTYPAFQPLLMHARHSVSLSFVSLGMVPSFCAVEIWEWMCPIESILFPTLPSFIQSSHGGGRR